MTYSLPEAADTAEAALIAGVIIDPAKYEALGIDSSHFFSVANRAIWEAVGRLRSRGDAVDELSVGAELGSALDAVGGISAITRLTINAGCGQNIDHYAGIIRDEYLTRSVLAKCSEIQTAAPQSTGTELLRLLSASSETLLGSLSGVERSLDDVVGRELTAALDPKTVPQGLITGLGIERWIPGGLPRKKVTTLFADTGSFKTTCVNQMMFAMAEAGYRGLLIPLEDSDELTAHRWISRKTGVPYGHIAGGVLTDAERQDIGTLRSRDWASLKNIRSCDGIEPNIDHIIRRVASAKARGGLDFVVLDYMQLLEGPGKESAVLTSAMKKAANAAKRYDVVWIMLSQKNDRSDERRSPRPTLKDMFGSSSMKQMSKTVLAIFRPSESWPIESLKGDKHPLWGPYVRFINRHPSGKEIYPNLIELWLLKNVLGKGVCMQGMIAQPELGILDPIDLRMWT